MAIVEQVMPDTRSRLEHQCVKTTFQQVGRSGEADRPRANHDDGEVFDRLGGHGVFNGS